MSEASNQREQLNFISDAKSAFQFLEDYAYAVVDEKATFLRYEGVLGFVNIFHGRQSYEVGVEFGPPDNPEEEVFFMGDLISLDNKSEAAGYFRPTADTPEAVEVHLKKQAQIFKDYGKRILNGDKTIWVDLQKEQSRRSIAYWRDVELRRARVNASQAFRSKRYQDYIDYLAAFEDKLTSSEKKKIEYARKHIDGL